MTRSDVLLTPQTYTDMDAEYEHECEEIYVPLTLYMLETCLLALKHCNRPSHKTAMTNWRGWRHRPVDLVDAEDHIEELMKEARRRLRERTDDGAGEVP